MLVKMNVVGNEIITVNTETGEIAGKTYNAKDWIKRNFEAKWNKEKKVWVADTEVIKKELENTRYYEKYIVSNPESKAEKPNTEKAEDAVQEKKIENDDEIIEEELVNGYDGFYVVRTWKSGKRTKHFIG